MRFDKAFGSALFLAFAASRVAFAGFEVTSSQPVEIAPGLFLVEMFAKNLGGDTGTKLLAAEVKMDPNAEARLLWHSSASGNPSIRNMMDLPDRSFLRIGGLSTIESNYTAQSPHSAWPAMPSFGPDTVYMPRGGAAYAGSMTGGVDASAGNGVLFGRLVFTGGYVGTIYGRVGGTVGPGYEYALTVANVNVPEPVSLAGLALLGTAAGRRRRSE